MSSALLARGFSRTRVIAARAGHAPRIARPDWPGDAPETGFARAREVMAGCRHDSGDPETNIAAHARGGKRGIPAAARRPARC